MKVNRLIPQGYCKGVINAINHAFSFENVKKPIYCLGPIIHNKKMIEKFNEKGIITIEDKITRLEMLDKINEGTIIISAHGASPLVYKKAISKGLYIIDTTCEYVKHTHNEIVKYLSDGYDVYYIGTYKHPECEGALGISNKINLIENKTDIFKYTFKDKSFIINQTTLSHYEISEIHELIKKSNPNVIISNSICNATTLRQQAVLNSEPADLTIVVGDKLSSNTKKLFLLASRINKSIQIEDINDLIDYDFKGIHEINITSGASTPKDVVDEIIEYLKQK